MKTVSAISVTQADGSARRMRVADWLELPAADRIQLLLKGKVQFLQADGSMIPPKEALALLRQRTG